MEDGRAVREGRPARSGRAVQGDRAPSGDYYAIALEAVESGRWYDEDFLDPIRRDATMFTLMEGETKTLDLKLQTAR